MASVSGGWLGGQASHTVLGTDLVAVAAGFASVSVSAREVPRVLPGRDGVEMKNRFRAALGLPGF